MARNYEFDAQAASEANSGSKRIKDSGAYIGTIKFAWSETNDKGTESVNLFFVSDNGQEAGPLALYTHKGDGTPLPSYNTLNAILRCAGVRTINAKKGPVELWNFDTRAVETKQKDVYPELTGKPIGLLLQREEYVGQNGPKERLIIYGAFQPKTRLVAKEIIDGVTTPHALDGMEKWLLDNPLKTQKKSRPVQGPRPAADDEFGDDVPF